MSATAYTTEFVGRQNTDQAINAFLNDLPVVNERIHVGEFGDTKVLFSYQKPIAVKRGDLLVITTRRYSMTSNRHVDAIRGAGTTRVPNGKVHPEYGYPEHDYVRNFLETDIENEMIENIVTGRADPFVFTFRPAKADIPEVKTRTRKKRDPERTAIGG